MLNAALEKMSELARHDCLVVLISDGLGLDEHSVRHLSGLTQHNDVLTVFVYDPMEKELPKAGHLVFAGSQGQLEINTSYGALNRDYRTAFDDRLNWLDGMSRKYAVPMLTISAAEDALEQVRRQLGHHAPARRR